MTSDIPPLSADEVLACGWQAAVEQCEDYADMWQALSSAAKAAEAERPRAARALQLLAQACSMQLAPDSVNAPFAPMISMSDGRRSPMPEDFSKQEVELLADTASGIDEVRLRARLADLAWLLKRPRTIDQAVLAIDAYRKLALTWETWINDGRSCWSRAVSLTYTIGKAAGSRLEEIEASHVSALLSAEAKDGFFAVQLSEAMLKYKLGKADGVRIAEHLLKLGAQALSIGEHPRARAHFEAAAKWLDLAGEARQAAEAVAKQAETWVSEAKARSQGPAPSSMVAASFYESAIQTYRTIPRAHREDLKVDQRIDDLRAALSEAAERSVGEFGTVKTEGIDISEIVEHAREAVIGKPVLEALRNLTLLYGGPKVDVLRARVIDNMRQFPLQALFASQTMSADGRVVAKSPGMGLGDLPAEGEETAIRHAMIRDFMLTAGLVVQGQILPAQDILLQEHRLLQGDFILLAKNSPIVPKDRAEMFGRALFAGYDRDFVTSIHLLAPQIENMVRMHLKAAGSKTTSLGLDGIETENGLSTLVELPQAKDVFGADLLFEIRANFCDGFGPNLRNQVAHGLLDEDQSQSIFSVYAWWMALRLVLAAFWNSRGRVSAQDSGAALAGNGAPA